MSENNHGGARKGGGRPPKITEIKLIEKLSPLEESAFKALQEGLETGDFPFVKLYFEYRFGKAKESLDVTTNGENINSVAPIEWLKDAED